MKQKSVARTKAVPDSKTRTTPRTSVPRDAPPSRTRPVPVVVPAASAPRQPAVALGPRAQRTIARIKDATREIFLSQGYGGTTVDGIANAANVSRASFYTYFSSKREVLIEVGDLSRSECSALIDRLSTVGASVGGLEDWVRDYFAFLDAHGSFALAWTQAAREDDEIRRAGMRGHLMLSRRLGEHLDALVGFEHADPRLLGLSTFSLLERSWDYVSLYAGAVERSDVEAQVARMIWGAIRPVAASVRNAPQA